MREWLLGFLWIAHFGISTFNRAVPLSRSGALVLLQGQVVTATSWSRVALGLNFSVLLLSPIEELNKKNYPLQPDLRLA